MPRGKIPFRLKIEREKDKTLIELLRERQGLDTEGMAKALGCVPQTISNTIQKAIDGGEKCFLDFQDLIIVRNKRRGRKPKETTETEAKPKEDLTAVQCTCPCGQEFKYATRINPKHPEDETLALKARRCPKCQAWGKMIAKFTISGKTITRAVLEKDGVHSEELVKIE